MKPIDYLEKFTKADQNRIRAHIKNTNFDEVAFHDAVYFITKELSKKIGHIGMAINGYVYYPTTKSMTVWEASDGSIIRCGLVKLLLDFCPPWLLDDILDGGFDLYIFKKVDQETYELGQMRGDWY